MWKITTVGITAFLFNLKLSTNPIVFQFIKKNGFNSHEGAYNCQLMIVT